MDPSRKGILKFLKRTTWKVEEISTGSELLDRGFLIPKGGTLLLRSEPYAGSTAVLIELAETLLSENCVVAYVDVADSIFSHRIKSAFKSPELLIVKPTSVEEILDVAAALKNLDSCLCLDSTFMIHDKWNLSKGIHRLAGRIKRVNSRATVLASQRGGQSEDFWNSVVDISFGEKRYKNRILIGHTVKVTGPRGETEHYIHYTNGRLKPAYEEAIKQVESGTPRHGWFKSQDKKIQGFWNFVDHHSEVD